MISTMENLESQFLGCMSPIIAMAAESDDGKRGGTRIGSDRKSYASKPRKLSSLVYD
jgi:hypothetical protein